jgi:predicted PurR-regulated permease PerM
MNKKLAAILLVVAVFALVPILISAQTPAESAIMGGLTGLSSQISVVENNIMSKLAMLDSMNQRLTNIEQALGTDKTSQQISPLVSGMQSLAQMVQIAVGLAALAVVLCIINLFMLLRKPKAAEPKEAKATQTKT